MKGGTKRAKEIVEVFRQHVREDGSLPLTIDIESCHNEGKFYATNRKQFVGYQQITRERNIIMIQMAPTSAKTLKEVFTVEWDWTRHEDRDRFLLEEFLYILYQFDDLILTGKNSKRFDIPYIRGRLVALGLPPMPEFTHIDVEEIMRKNLYLNSYALDYFSKFIGGSGKVKMDREDWFDIENGSELKLAKMRKYGKKDVIDTNKAAKVLAPHCRELRTWANIKGNGELCPHCLEKKMKWPLQKRGFIRSPGGKRQAWRCVNKRHPKHMACSFIETRVQRNK